MIHFDLFLLQNPAPSPLSSLGHFTCSILTRVTGFLPESPITLADIADQLAETVPFVGSYLIYKAFANLATVLALVVLYKIFRVLPGKFS